jgi:acyl-lipid omega-6 desaturase (Delta-12 desaturase)
MIDVQKYRPNNLMAFREITLQILWLATGFYFSSINELWILGQILLGIGFWRAFAILHACGHNAFFNNRFLNILTGISQSLFCFIPFYTWKYIHEAHHVWTGWKDLDPTTSDLDRPLSGWKKKVLNFCWKYWIPIISIHYIFSVFIVPSKRIFYKSSLQAYLSVGLVTVLHATLSYRFGLIYFKFLGLSTYIYLNMGDLSLLTQHIHIPLDHSQGLKVLPKHPKDQELYSHTTLLPEFVTRWIVLAFNHHALHHIHPRIPYYYSHLINFQGTNTHQWKDWLATAKGMKASDLIYTNSPTP